MKRQKKTERTIFLMNFINLHSGSKNKIHWIVSLTHKGNKKPCVIVPPEQQ